MMTTQSRTSLIADCDRQNMIEKHGHMSLMQIDDEKTTIIELCETTMNNAHMNDISYDTY